MIQKKKRHAESKDYNLWKRDKLLFKPLASLAPGRKLRINT